MTWAANMVVELGTGVPWVMCKQDDAPDPIVIKLNKYNFIKLGKTLKLETKNDEYLRFGA